MADKQTAIVIHEDGTETKHFPVQGNKFEYSELNKLTEGYFQMLSNFRYSKTGKIVKSVYVNEEGLLKGMRPNPVASAMWEGGINNARLMGERYSGVVGPVVMVFPRDPTDEHGRRYVELPPDPATLAEAMARTR